MSASISEINDFPSLQKWLKDYCERKGYICWHDYGPADLPKYSSDPVKILLMNAESFDNEGNIPADAYLRWIKDGWRTARYSSVLVALIRDYISRLVGQKSIPAFDKSLPQSLYQNIERLVDVMRGTIYVNARITSNDKGSSTEDKARVGSDVVEFAAHRKRFVEILKPRIIICAGGSAKDALFLEGGAFEKSALKSKSVFEVEDFIIISTRHLSRPNQFGGYKNLHQVASECATAYVQKWCSKN